MHTHAHMCARTHKLPHAHTCTETGDYFCAVDGVDISALSTEEVAALFGRKPGAPLELTLWRDKVAKMTSPSIGMGPFRCIAGGR